MNPTIDAAWIAAASGFLGVITGIGGTVAVAFFGFRSTREATTASIAAGAEGIKAQLEADRRNRIWEKQAAAYTEAISGILHRQEVRGGQWQGMVTGSEPPAPASPVDWRELESRLIAYASPAVIAALRDARTAGARFADAVGMWAVLRTAAQAPGGGPPGGARPRDARATAEEAFAEATRLDDLLIDAIRCELHAGVTGEPDPPVALSPAGGQADSVR
jgi:hypothetical protein